MTNMTQADEVVIKADVLGRVRTSRERREQLLDEFEKSGLTGQKFAAVVGIKYQTFATWAQKRRRQRGAYPAIKRPKQLRWRSRTSAWHQTAAIKVRWCWSWPAERRCKSPMPNRRHWRRCYYEP